MSDFYHLVQLSHQVRNLRPLRVGLVCTGMDTSSPHNGLPLKEIQKCAMLKYHDRVMSDFYHLVQITSPVSEAREDPKVINYIQAGLDKANAVSISRAAKIQVQ